MVGHDTGPTSAWKGCSTHYPVSHITNKWAVTLAEADLEHDFVVFAIAHGQHSVSLDIQMLQQLLHTLAFAGTSRQNLQPSTCCQHHIVGQKPSFRILPSHIQLCSTTVSYPQGHPIKPQLASIKFACFAQQSHA